MSWPEWGTNNEYGQGSTSNNPYAQQNSSRGFAGPAVPAVHVIGATPGNSPVVSTSFPPAVPPRGHLVPLGSPEQSGMSDANFTSYPYTLTALDLFKSLPPPRVYQGSNNLVFISSTTNDSFGDVGPLTKWPFDNIELQYYNVLARNKVAHPPNYDALKVIISEADVVHAAINEYLTPVNIAFKELLNQYGIHHEIYCRSEDTHHAKANRDGKDFVQISRVDLSWGYWHPSSNAYVRFGILEFKKPGALTYTDFENSYQTVLGSGAKICRQLKKYCQAYGMPRAACCSYDALICFNFEGNMSIWQGNPGPKTPARFRWVKREDIAGSLVVFLFECLRQSFIVQSIKVANFST